MNIRLDVEKIIDIVQNINTKINNFPYNDDSHEEFDNLIESACHIIDDTITQNPLELSNPKFNDILKDYVINIAFGKKVFEAAPKPKKALFVQNAGHNNLFEFNLVNKILNYLKKY